MPDYPGSMWRGAMGHALYKTVCVTHLKACPPCLLYRSCPYPYIFETPVPLDARKMRKYTAAPHPFLLELEGALEDGIGIHDGLHGNVGLTLIGRGNTYLSYLIHAFERAGKQGVGKGRVPMTMLDVLQAGQVDAEEWTPIYEPGGVLRALPPAVPRIPTAPRTIRLRLRTPLRLQRDEDLVMPANFHFSDLFGPLLRRVSMLTYFHTDTPLDTDFAALTEQARQVEPAAVNLAWKDWTRYSSRQKTAMKMGGLVGEIVLELCADSPLWPYLWLGQWVHAGKGTSMGLGRYTIETASLPNRKSAGG